MKPKSEEAEKDSAILADINSDAPLDDAKTETTKQKDSSVLSKLNEDQKQK